jgi:DNA helicase IV
VPGEVLDFANRLLPLIAPGLSPATAVRSEPGSLSVRAVSALGPPLVDVVTELRAAPGSIGIVCPDAAVAEVTGLLTAAGVPATALTDDGAEAAAVAVVPATLAKGLEFDAVVVVDPAAIVAAEPRGLHRLHAGRQHSRRAPPVGPPGTPGALITGFPTFHRVASRADYGRRGGL